jgi:hypothetical protein
MTTSLTWLWLTEPGGSLIEWLGITGQLKNACKKL